jgi:hypothetical protein
MRIRPDDVTDILARNGGHLLSKPPHLGRAATTRNRIDEPSEEARRSAATLRGTNAPAQCRHSLFQADVSASLTPVTWSRLQVRGPTMATTLTPSRMAAHVDAWNLAYYADTFGVTAGETTP